METLSVQGFRDNIGKLIGTSKWFIIHQGRIDAFADVTEDHQFIHVDPEKAAKTPFGQTVAHGFLTLSMLSAMSYDAIPRIKGLKMGSIMGSTRSALSRQLPQDQKYAHISRCKILKWKNPAN